MQNTGSYLGYDWIVAKNPDVSRTDIETLNYSVYENKSVIKINFPPCWEHNLSN